MAVHLMVEVSILPCWQCHCSSICTQYIRAWGWIWGFHLMLVCSKLISSQKNTVRCPNKKFPYWKTCIITERKGHIWGSTAQGKSPYKNSEYSHLTTYPGHKSLRCFQIRTGSFVFYSVTTDTGISLVLNSHEKYSGWRWCSISLCTPICNTTLGLPGGKHWQGAPYIFGIAVPPVRVNLSMRSARETTVLHNHSVSLLLKKSFWQHVNNGAQKHNNQGGLSKTAHVSNCIMGHIPSSNTK